MVETRGHAILPADNDIQEAPRIIVEPGISAPDGSFWVFNGAGYDRAVDPWAVEQHIPPTNRAEQFGDVEGWTDYVRRFADGRQGSILTTWAEGGLLAVLDYASDIDTPGRCQWTARHPFVLHEKWDAWAKFANGETEWTQEQVVRKLDLLAVDIKVPDSATVLDIVRNLRATVKLEAASELRPDGGSVVSFSKDSQIRTRVPVPEEILVSVPVLKGHVAMADVLDDDGDVVLEDGQPKRRLQPVSYAFPVRVRPSVNDETHKVTFRFFMPLAERTLEMVYADRLALARERLGEGYEILRAAS